MNTSQVTIKSYLPPEKRERSKLQQVKDKHRSFTQTNKKGVPKDLNELKLIKYRDHAIAFLNEYMNTDKKTTKSKYCKTHHISHNSLNTGLKLLGYKTSIKSEQSRPNETKPDQSRPNETKQKKQRLIKAGHNNTEHSFASFIKDEAECYSVSEMKEEDLQEMINSSLANLQVGSE